MQATQLQASHINLPGLREIKVLIEESLTHDWILRIEHAAKAGSADPQWREWGDSSFAVTDASTVIDKIIACHASFPGHAMRLNAEKVYPRTQLFYGFHLPEKHDATVPAFCMDAAATKARVNAWLSSLSDGVRSAGARAWRIITVFGMLIVSLLLLEEAMV